VIGRFWCLLELALAFAALVGAGVSWSHASHPVAVAPIADGQPATTSLVYDPQLLLLTLVLATIAGVLAVLGTARLRRGRAASSPGPNARGRRELAL
jgi:NO-binding membrane sensor protein with MHYT domain